MGVNILDFDGKCPMCSKEIDMSSEFKDNLSVKEYFISGLCQSCQDKAFGYSDEHIEKITDEWIPNQASLEENVEKVKAKLEEVIKDLELKLPETVFNFDDFYIAGGCIYSIWNDKNPKDYDIFCKNKAALSKVQQYFKENSCNFTSENAITYGKYQFVTKWYGNPDDEVGKFDFKHNMFYYDSDGLHNLVDWGFLNSNKLVFNNLRARDISSILSRIPKFISRGMEIDADESWEILDAVTKPKNYIKERISIKRRKSSGRSGY